MALRNCTSRTCSRPLLGNSLGETRTHTPSVTRSVLNQSATTLHKMTLPRLTSKSWLTMIWQLVADFFTEQDRRLVAPASCNVTQSVATPSEYQQRYVQILDKLDTFAGKKAHCKRYFTRKWTITIFVPVSSEVASSTSQLWDWQRSPY